MRFFCSLTPAKRDFFSELIIITKLILVMPATNASSERYFSALRRIKTYLRNTISQERLNHLMLLYVHKEQTDLLNLCDVVESSNIYVCICFNYDNFIMKIIMLTQP